ncbi:MAG: beta-galactosidase trimerization domain-containing protein [Clostridiales bacterium]|nr:beta-galactosidase trimerization domain-containing protein [Clostridiales bacterium]
MSDLYKKTYRGYLIDHHSPDPPIVTFENLDIDEYERFFQEANINNLMVYCKDHWGITYYDTAVGKMHPGLKEDWIKQIVPVLKRNNVEFNAYYCLEYDNHACITHPEWRTLQADGTPLTCAYNKAQWKMPCYETEYRKYALTQLDEIVKNYNPDSLFLDIFGKSLCYCDTCKGKFYKQYGYELPESEEELTRVHNDIIEFLDNCAKEMLKEIISVVKGIDEDIKVTINFAALYNKEIRDMLDYQFTEPWASNFLSAAYARDTAIGQYPQLGPGDVSEVYNYKADSIYELAVAQITANGCRAFIYSGSQHPDGTLEHVEAEKVGIAYEEVKKFEGFLQNRKVISDIAIVQDDYSSKIVSSSSVIANAIGRVKAGSSHRDGLLGAMKLCNYLKIPWSVVPKDNLNAESINNYKVIILPSIYYIDNKFKAVIQDFARNGGIVIANNTTSLYNIKGKRLDNFSLSELFGAEHICENTKYENNDWGSYLDLSVGDVYKGFYKTTPPVESIRQTIIAKDSKVLAKFINPATEITSDKWVNWWSPPPKNHTDDPAIILNEYGEGKVAYFAFDIFKMENNGFNLNKDIFTTLIGSIYLSPSIYLETDSNNILDYVSYISEDKKSIIIHQISNMASMTKGDVVSISGGRLKINASEYSISEAKIVYPYKDILDINIVESYYSINLPNIDIHNIFICELRSNN